MSRGVQDDARRNLTKGLVASGQLEFINGAWQVSPRRPAAPALLSHAAGPAADESPHSHPQVHARRGLPVLRRDGRPCVSSTLPHALRCYLWAFRLSCLATCRDHPRPPVPQEELRRDRHPARHLAGARNLRPAPTQTHTQLAQDADLFLSPNPTLSQKFVPRSPLPKRLRLINRSTRSATPTLRHGFWARRPASSRSSGVGPITRTWSSVLRGRASRTTSGRR